MKSYNNHLKSRLEYGEVIEVGRKPVLRSSAIFPVIKNENFSSRILFLGYWFLKRKISEVGLTVTLRSDRGEILVRTTQIIDTVQAFRIELDLLLNEINFKSNFLGSIEVEFHSSRDMVFPFPALVLEYFGQDFNTCVHTTQRIYNDFEDLLENEQFKVPESGFDIHSTSELSSFISFVNGPMKNHEGIINYVVTNSQSEKLHGTFNLGLIQPYETKFILINEHIPQLKNFLQENSGSISITHNFEGFFPRLLVGNIQSSFPSLSFTHSYYDCSSCKEESDFWSRLSPDFYDSAVYIPLFLTHDLYTDLVVYPNFSPSNFHLDILLYDQQGKKIHQFNDLKQFNSNDSKLTKINFNKLVDDTNLDKNFIRSAHIITKFSDSKIPSRIKFGLNVGMRNSKSKIPCNICFNSKVGNPKIDSKPGSFHWAPIFVKNSVLTISNFSPKRNYSKDAKVELSFFRKHDSEFLSKEFFLKANSEFRLELDQKLKDFLNQEDGWVTIKSDNPYIQGFYFKFNDSGSVAGDHFF